MSKNMVHRILPVICLFLLKFSILVLLFSSCVGNTPAPTFPTILGQPSDISVHDGQRAVFEVQALNGSTYQWRRDGVEIVGAHSASYIMESPNFSDDASRFSVVVGNTIGTVTSEEALLTILPNDPRVMTFTSEEAVFSPILVLQAGTVAEVTWTFADGSQSHALHPEMNYGLSGTRANTLYVNPWSAVRRINLGYDGGDGGSYDIETNLNQNVSSVVNLNLVTSYLMEWCSSYNDFTSLDFSHFIKLETIECFLSSSLTTVNLADTPRLRRACFEDCSLTGLDLSQSPALEDLRGALNNYSDINFGTIGENVWHICIRENHFLTDASMFSDTAKFPQIAELFIWQNNQSGTLRVPSTSETLSVDIEAAQNGYVSLDLRGALQNTSRLGTVNLQNNSLTSVDITGCIQITSLNLSQNDLDTTDIDAILTEMDVLNLSDINAPAGAPLVIDLRGNAGYSDTGAVHAQNLASKGWTVYTDGHTDIPQPPEDTGEVRIDFSTNGDSTSMATEVTGSPTIVWHWSDGTTSTGITAAKAGLGIGSHSHYVTISNGSAVTRFGAAAGGGNGHLENIAGLANCPFLTVIYAYNEPNLTSIGRTNTTRIKEYHLMATAISTAEMDVIFADAVETTVVNGIFYCANRGTIASDGNRGILVGRGWVLN